eukprot:TRINITY_DN119_c4_g1_i2.p1 TRINITY_DN119_c4_g1~~TRINITY_DN119_c4_g1_i2.p1  ORF type:complete len:514 (-),score=117.71 TRINITY_DN119_c4_g1_i2:42-1583(-)
MLNTDIHNPSNKRKMTQNQFISLIAKLNQGKDFKRSYLRELYQQIVDHEMQMQPPDAPPQVCLKSGWLTSGWREKSWYTVTPSGFSQFDGPNSFAPKREFKRDLLKVARVYQLRGGKISFCLEYGGPKTTKLKLTCEHKYAAKEWLKALDALLGVAPSAVKRRKKKQRRQLKAGRTTKMTLQQLQRKLPASASSSTLYAREDESAGAAAAKPVVTAPARIDVGGRLTHRRSSSTPSAMRTIATAAAAAAAAVDSSSASAAAGSSVSVISDRSDLNEEDENESSEATETGVSSESGSSFATSSSSGSTDDTETPRRRSRRCCCLVVTNSDSELLCYRVTTEHRIWRFFAIEDTVYDDTKEPLLTKELAQLLTQSLFGIDATDGLSRVLTALVPELAVHDKVLRDVKLDVYLLQLPQGFALPPLPGSGGITHRHFYAQQRVQANCCRKASTAAVGEQYGGDGRRSSCDSADADADAAVALRRAVTPDQTARHHHEHNFVCGLGHQLRDEIFACIQ